jgi:hypothetical protein
MGFPLPCAPGSVGRQPCGQGPPQMWPDGAGQSFGKVVNEEDDDEDDESSSDSSNFVRRPKRLSGFHLAANSFSIDQWQSLRRLNASASLDPAKTEVVDYRRPRWDTPSSQPKVDWESTIAASRRAASALTELAESASFKLSLFPASLLHAEANLHSKKAFQEEVQRMDAANACGLALVRCGELAHATLGKDLAVIIRM